MSDEIPREVEKPWGSELWWAHTDRYAGKILRVNAGHKLRIEDRYGRAPQDTRGAER